VQLPKYCKEHVAVFNFICTNNKSTKNASVRLLLCHTSENMVYSLILNITVTVEKTHKSEWAMGQNIAKNIWQSSVWAVLAQKYWKCESKTFTLPHKREYGLQPYLEYSRNCWKSHKPQWRMNQNIWQFLIWAVLTKKSIKDARVLLSFCHTSENTVCWSLEVFACSRNSWKNTQATMCRGQNIAKNM